jgi:hypothetical protein
MLHREEFPVEGIPTKAGWRPNEFGRDTGLSKTSVNRLLKNRVVEFVKVGSATIITTSPAEYLKTVRDRRRAGENPVSDNDVPPDFPSECWFHPCRCRVDKAALQGRDGELCRENGELRQELEELRAELAAAR